MKRLVAALLIVLAACQPVQKPLPPPTERGPLCMNCSPQLDTGEGYSWLALPVAILLIVLTGGGGIIPQQSK